jgi:uncharacterized protein (UPF0332 family)
MSFDWNEYLKLAKHLAEKTDVASLRTAVSRSYYCIFNLSMIKAKANGFVPKDDAGSHDQLWSLYSRNTDKTCRHVSVLGQRMKRRRIKADYIRMIDNLDTDVKDAIADAEECVSLLSALQANLPEDIPRSYHY